MGAISPDAKVAIDAARLARLELGAGLDAPISDALRLIEGPGEVPVTIDRDLPEGLAGALFIKRGRAFILISGADHPVRQRFTLAHEYGHWRLGHGVVVDGPESFSSSHPHEVQANGFAAEFLAPVPAVQAWMDARSEPEIGLQLVVEMSVAFGISAEAALYRLDAARYIPQPKNLRKLKASIRGGEHRSLMYSLGLQELQDSIAAAQDDLPRLPVGLRSNALAGYQQGLLDVERLAGLLREDPERTEQELERHGITPVEPDEGPDW